jgi:transposase
VDLTALFLNSIPPDERPVLSSVELADEGVQGVTQTGPVQRRTFLDEGKILDLIASYVAGTTIMGLATEFNVNPTTVYEHLRRQQVERRPFRKVRPAQVAVAVELYKAGTSMRQVARYLGVSPDTAKRILVEAGVIPPPAPRG